MKCVPMLQVDDVEAASRWYRSFLGVVSGHGGPDYEMLFAGEPYASPMLLHLHRWDADEHGFMGSRDVPRGNGTSLWFEVADRAALDATWGRVVELSVEVLEAPHWNPLAHHHELTVRDRDGYVVVVHTPFDPSSLGVGP